MTDKLEAVAELPDTEQAKIEAECQDIDNLACQGGITALADEAEFHQDQGFPEANWCTLRHDGRDEAIRQMLANSGIDLLEHSPPETDKDA